MQTDALSGGFTRGCDHPPALSHLANREHCRHLSRHSHDLKSHLPIETKISVAVGSRPVKMLQFLPGAARWAACNQDSAKSDLRTTELIMRSTKPKS